MRDWRAYVRARLRIPELTPARESRIIREVAAQLEDFYRDARARGLDDPAADAHACAQIPDWARLADEVRRADRAHVQPRIDRVVSTIEARPRAGGLSLMVAQALRDVRYGIRQMLHAPGFTLIAVLTLALGVGATTAIFSVVNGVLLRPLPYPESAALVRVHELVPELGRFSVAPATFLDWRAENRVFDRIAAYQSSSGTFTTGAGPERVQGATVSWDLFPLLRVAPMMGNAFSAEQDKPGANNVLLISYSAWVQRFGSNPGVVGSTTPFNGVPFTIVGVMPKDFHFPNRTAEFWRPLGLPATGSTRGGHFLGVVARLKKGVTVERAGVEMKAISERLARQYPQASAGESAEVIQWQENMVAGIRPALLTLIGAVSVVALIACANVANLLLVRASVREKEVAIRAALGAGRGRLIVQMLAESIVLGVVGGGLGLLLAYAAIQPLQALSAGSIPRVAEVSIDGRVLGFTALASVLTGLLFGLAPAWHAARTGLGGMLKEGGRSSSTIPGRLMRSALLVVEVALSILLLVGAALLLRSFENVTHVDPGFQPEKVLAFQVSLPQAKYPDDARQNAFFDALLDKLRAQPGVKSASVVQALPMRGNYSLSFTVRGRPTPEPGKGPSANYRVISTDFFQTLGIRIVKGRALSSDDVNTPRMVAVVDQAFAKKFFPGEEPIGQGINIGNGTKDDYDIVGVVGDIHHENLETVSDPTMYVPVRTDSFGALWILARADGDPAQLAMPVRQIVRDLDATLPAYSISPLATVVSDSFAQRRFSMLLIARSGCESRLARARATCWASWWAAG
jgi:putative ABC transport system permease protein